jgi:N-acetylglucosaminyl-diphospho-decaprenol L-rhamnosyltransferase
VELSILIVNWNTKDHLKGCLFSLKEKGHSSCQVIVVDNDSTDGSSEMVASDYPTVQLIKNDKNRGFAAANNQAYKLSTGRIILLLNPDIIVKKGSLEILMNFLDKTPDAGACGPRMLGTDGKEQMTGYYQSLPTAFNFIIRKNDPMVTSTGDTVKVEQIPGACFMIKREVIEKIGFMDERFFVWMDDVDLSARILKAGRSLYMVKDAEVVHIGGVSFKKLFKWQWWLMWRRSLVRYFFKHRGPFEGSIIWLYTLPKTLAAYGMKMLGMK